MILHFEINYKKIKQLIENSMMADIRRSWKERDLTYSQQVPQFKVFIHRPRRYLLIELKTIENKFKFIKTRFYFKLMGNITTSEYRVSSKLTKLLNMM